MDASFAFHHDFRSHTGAIVTMVQGAVKSVTRKQKLDMRIKTEVELVVVNDTSV